MELLRAKKIKIKTVSDNGGIKYFVNYQNIKEENLFFGKLVEDFLEDRDGLLIVDSDYLYEKNTPDARKKLINLKKVLDGQNIIYKEIVTKKEAEYKFLGIKIQNTGKVDFYQIGLGIRAVNIKNIAALVSGCNVFCYMGEKGEKAEELMERFLEIKGDYQELNQSYPLNLFYDIYFHRISICCQEDKKEEVENKLKKYQE